jgi:hypothetical protein
MWGRERNVFVTAWASSLIVVACAANAPTASELAERDRQSREGEEITRKNIIVGWVSVSVPVGRFLLIRRGKDYCAVRFTEFHREVGRAMPWSVPDDSQYAEYDWYYQGDGTGDFMTPNVESGHQKLYQKPTRFFHPFESIGVNVVRCGPFHLRWDYPTQVGFHNTNRKEDDVGNELAPTKWRDISEVNANHPRLKWYRYDEKREPLYIPIDQLW